MAAKAGIFSFRVTDGIGGTLTQTSSITITKIAMTAQLVTVHTRSGITMNVLLVNPSSPPKRVLVSYLGERHGWFWLF